MRGRGQKSMKAVPPRRALITGASSGIGAALSQRLARRGIEVWLAARRLPELEIQVNQISQAGGKAHALQLDVSDPDETGRKATGVGPHRGRHRPGGSQRVGLRRRRFERSAEAVPLVRCPRRLSGESPGRGGHPHLLYDWYMLSRGHVYWQLVGISSLAAADLPLPRGVAYGASKAGLTFFLRSIDIELRPLGVAVTAIQPGFIRTPMTDRFDRRQMPFLIDLEPAMDRIESANIQEAGATGPLPLAHCGARSIRGHAPKLAERTSHPKSTGAPQATAKHRGLTQQSLELGLSLEARKHGIGAKPAAYLVRPCLV